MKKQNMAKDIRVHGLSRPRIMANELEGIIQILARAADRIEKLETALKSIANGGVTYNSNDVARKALKYP